jgi:hypothetical protein
MSLIEYLRDLIAGAHPAERVVLAIVVAAVLAAVFTGA